MTPAGLDLGSATTRPVPMRMRPDLTIRAQQYGGVQYWVVKDPLALSYFHLRDEEHAILHMLDGQTSLGELKRRFEESFAPLRVTVEQLQAFVGRMHQFGLLLADTPDQGEEMLRRGRRRRGREWAQFFINLLAIRFRGLDPEPLLARLYPFCRWLFAPWLLGACLLTVAAAVLLAVLRFDVLRARLPTFGAFFTPANAIWLAVALALVKVLHELGHALTAKHFGAECHEIGVLLLVFTPCLYCNVSDAWLLPSKWQRIAVSAAGVAVEVVLAAVCTFLWWWSEPGLLNTLCLSIMGVCSVNTLLFNGNPLLRYDGYYILADLLEVPNLAQQARAVSARLLAGFFLGLDLPTGRTVARNRRAILVTYEIGAALYRWLVVLAILWFCHRLLKPYGLEVLAEGLALIVIGGMLAGPVLALAALVRDPGYRRRIRRVQAALTLLGAAAVVAAGLAIPLPCRITAPAVLQPQDARHVYVVVPGTLAGSIPPGTRVEQGQELARLVNLDVQREIVDLSGQRDQQRLQLENLRLRLAADPAVASQIPSAEEALADIDQRLRQRQHDQQRLLLRAPAAGTVLPPPLRLAGPYVPGRLDAWTGSPLEERCQGSYLETGTLFCLIGDPQRLEATLLVDQADMKFVRPGQRVRLALDELPGRVLQGTVTEIANAEVKVAPRELSVRGDLPVRADAQGVPRPVETSYQARVALDEHPYRLLTGTRGRGKILADPQSLAQRLFHYLGRTFHFQL